LEVSVCFVPLAVAWPGHSALQGPYQVYTAPYGWMAHAAFFAIVLVSSHLVSYHESLQPPTVDVPCNLLLDVQQPIRFAYLVDSMHLSTAFWSA
jgi:hypothetical protein